MPPTPPRYHEYDAEAVALSGSLRLPLIQEVEPPTFVKLNERGGYLRSMQRITGSEVQSLSGLHTRRWLGIPPTKPQPATNGTR